MESPGCQARQELQKQGSDLDFSERRRRKEAERGHVIAVIAVIAVTAVTAEIADGRRLPEVGHVAAEACFPRRDLGGMNVDAVTTQCVNNTANQRQRAWL